MFNQTTLKDDLYHLFLILHKLDTVIKSTGKSKLKVTVDSFCETQDVVRRIVDKFRYLPSEVRVKHKLDLVKIAIEKLLTLFEYKNGIFTSAHFVYHAEELDLTVFNERLLELAEKL